MLTKKLIKTLVLPLAILAIFAAGCSKNNSVLGPDGGNQQISFQISQQPGNLGGVQFLFRPAVNVKISKIVSSLPAQQFADTIRFNNTNIVYSKDTTYIVGEYTGVQNGQQWNFNFSGQGNTNANYSVNVNYTAQ